MIHITYIHINALITDRNVLSDNNSAIDNDACASLKPGRYSPNNSRSSTLTILPGSTQTKPNIDQHLKHFKSNFDGSPVINIKLTDSNIPTGSWHPLK